MKNVWFFFPHSISENGMVWYVNKFRFSVQFWTEISAETKRCYDTETEISAEIETETESFRSLIATPKNCKSESFENLKN